MKTIFLIMAASLMFMACGHNNTSAKDGEGTEANAELDTCWKQSDTVLDGLKVEITSEGGVKLVWTDWDMFMDCMENALCINYPFDAPFTEEEIININGKVKGLAVMGNPMAPNVYMLLEDNSVQLYSVDKMCNTWDFYAGSIIGHDIVSIKDVVKDYSITTLVDKNGKETKDEEFFVDGANLYGYTQDGDDLQIEQLKIGTDGSITYIYKYQFDDQEYAVYHGYVTSCKRNGDTLVDTYDYVLNLQDQPEGTNLYKKVDIKGQFTIKNNDELDGHYTIVPKSGFNMAGFDNAKLGEPRDMLVEATIKEYLGIE